MSQLQQRCEVFSLDTGRLHPQTYRFIETRNHYDLPIKIVMPDSHDVAALVQQKGLFSFRNDGHEECCATRKINPLRSELAQLDAWITGQRIDQSVTRTELAEVHVDGVFDGRNGALENSILSPTGAQQMFGITFVTVRCPQSIARARLCVYWL